MVHDSNNCESLINERYLDEIIRAENFIFQYNFFENLGLRIRLKNRENHRKTE